MEASGRYCLLVTSIGLLTALIPAAKAANQPAGAASCSGAFEVDGLPVSSTATLFAGSRIESTTVVCTVRRTSGATIRVEPQSGIIITDTGVTLTNGTIRIQGNLDLGLSATKVVIHPTTPATIVQARFTDNQLLVNVSTGSATLVGPKSELYARLDTGTLMRFAPAPEDPSGIYLWVFGCLHSAEDNWSLSDRHIQQQVELLGDTVRKNLQPVGVWGSPQPLAADASQAAARLRIVQETPEERACFAFTPSSNLNGDEPAGRRKTAAAILISLGTAAVDVAVTRPPGQNPTSASIP